MTPAVDTKATADYRELRFESTDDYLAEIERIVEADKNGTLQAAGNWSAGQVMAHLASWIEYGYEGFPIKKPPFFIRWILRMRLQKMLRDGMPRGVRIPGVKGGTTGMDEMETEAAARWLEKAIHRLQSDEEAKYDSPAFGPMSDEDRIRLNLRHAELHLGYLSY